jgi:hypothetical protein
MADSSLPGQVSRPRSAGREGGEGTGALGVIALDARLATDAVLVAARVARERRPSN